eukprot:CAMPEP_0172332194 /NCGR_PEP_ID=MMETSP1058-20130122/62313_1 /TAXON_ID=83371 /ORGANISM="Detonula confervacea, Strain CCMP 353" /LENGTH=41 /DNA_ID= /DNA_START= /DNA_END= /DNA_ORIENTATION=
MRINVFSLSICVSEQPESFNNSGDENQNYVGNIPNFDLWEY